MRNCDHFVITVCKYVLPSNTASRFFSPESDQPLNQLALPVILASSVRRTDIVEYAQAPHVKHAFRGMLPEHVKASRCQPDYSRLHWNVHSRKTRKLFCGADGMTMASGSVIRLASITLADCGSGAASPSQSLLQTPHTLHSQGYVVPVIIITLQMQQVRDASFGPLIIELFVSNETFQYGHNK
jgi:hypothetical protein